MNMSNYSVETQIMNDQYYNIDYESNEIIFIHYIRNVITLEREIELLNYYGNILKNYKHIINIEICIDLIKKILYRYLQYEQLIFNNIHMLKCNIDIIFQSILVISEKMTFENYFNARIYNKFMSIEYWENKILTALDFDLHKNIYIIELPLYNINVSILFNKIYNYKLYQNKIYNNINNINNIINYIDDLNNYQLNTDNTNIISINNNEYKIINKISAGTYGLIYKIVNIHNNKIYVLKSFKSNNNTIHYINLNEITLNIMLDHDNISKIKDICFMNNKICIIMEYYGLPINHLKNKLYFNMTNIKLILKQLLEAVNYLHKNNIMHRDLSSNNVLLNQDNKLTIIDFGFSKFNYINQIFNHNVYTVCYRAPEIFLHNKYDSKIDMWAVGCMLGEMLCNDILFNIDKEDDEKNLNTIFKFIGSPKNFINNNKKIINVGVYHASIKYFIDLYEDENLSDLFIKLLEFNPKKRIDAENALLHPYFN